MAEMSRKTRERRAERFRGEWIAAAEHNVALITFGVYGVAGWAGPMRLGGWGGQGVAPRRPFRRRRERFKLSEVHKIRLVHGVVSEERSPSVVVQTCDPARPQWMRPELRTTRGEIGVQLPVDGRVVAFRCTRQDGLWSAWTEGPDLVLFLIARGLEVEDVALGRVRDLAPYVEGARRAMFERSTTALL